MSLWYVYEMIVLAIAYILKQLVASILRLTRELVVLSYCDDESLKITMKLRIPPKFGQLKNK